MRNISIGDEVYSCSNQLRAHVNEVFPAAVCVRVGVLERHRHLELISAPQLWRAEEIENLSICHCCGTRENLIEDSMLEHGTGVPFRICAACAAGPISSGSNGNGYYPHIPPSPPPDQ
jgi:hypothetical protein